MLRPVLIDSGARLQAADSSGAWESLRTARAAMEDISSSSATLRKRFADLGDQKMRAMAARALIEAGYDVEPGQLGAFESTTAAADAAIARASAEQDLAATQLHPYENNVTQRIAAALHILESSGSNSSAAFSDLAQHASTITRVLVVMNRAHRSAAALWSRLAVLDLVIVYTRTRPNREKLGTYLYDLENVRRKLLDEVRRHVSDTPYPLTPPGVQRSLCDYLRGSDVTTEDIGAVLRDARTHARLFFELYLRVVAEIALVVEQVEASQVAAV